MVNATTRSIASPSSESKAGVENDKSTVNAFKTTKATLAPRRATRSTYESFLERERGPHNSVKKKTNLDERPIDRLKTAEIQNFLDPKPKSRRTHSQSSDRYAAAALSWSSKPTSTPWLALSKFNANETFSIKKD